MSPLTVLHVIPSLGRGGAERQLVNLLRADRASDTRHVVCRLGPPGDLAAVVTGSGGESIDLGLASTRNWLAAASRLRRIARRQRPDVMQSWLFDAGMATWLARLAWSDAPPWVSTFHSPDYDPFTIRVAGLPGLTVSAFRTLDRLQARWSDARFVAVSGAVADAVKRDLGIASERLRVIPNSVDPGLLEVPPGAAATVRRELGLLPEDTVFLAVGRLDPQKGHTWLIEAFASVVAEMPSAHLVIVGGGPLHEQLSTRADALGIASHVHLPGQTTVMGAIYRAADVFVMPSQFEGFGIALIEAMWASVPCIVTAIPALEEVGGSAVRTVALGDNNALIASMKELASDSATRARLGRDGNRRVADHYLTTAVLPQWHDLWKQMTNEHQS